MHFYLQKYYKLYYKSLLCTHTHIHSFNGLLSGASYAAVEARIRIGWNKFRQLAPLLTNKDVSLIMTGRLYSSCVRSSMLHGSETWPVRKENVVALQRAEMRMVASRSESGSETRSKSVFPSD